ncbi:MAG: HAMP domain-containing sensor histidine kinase [Nitrososphaerales archaeon]
MRLVSKILLITGAVVGIALVNIIILSYFNMLQESYAATLDLANRQILIVRDIKEHSLLIASGGQGERVTASELIYSYEKCANLLSTGGFVNGSQIKSVRDLSPALNEEMHRRWTEYKQNALVVVNEDIFNQDVLDARDYVVQNSSILFNQAGEASRRLQSLELYAQNNISDMQLVGLEHVATAKAIETIGPRLLSYTLEVTGQPTERFGAVQWTELSSELHRLSDRYDSYLTIMLEGGESDIVGGYVNPLPAELRGDWEKVKRTWEPVKKNLDLITEKGMYTQEFYSALQYINNNTEPLLALHLDIISLLRSDMESNSVLTSQVSYTLVISSAFAFAGAALVISRSMIPITKVIAASKQIHAGEYGVQITHKGEDEVGNLVKSFNLMSSAMKKKIKQREEIERAKDEFLAMITHELKTPLVPIQGYSELLLDGTLGELTEEQKDKIRIMHESSLSLSQLIQDLLDARRLELDQMKFSKEKVDAKELVYHAVEIMLPEVARKGAKIRTQIEKPITVTCDRDRIVQVLTNLIKNSVKFVQEQKGIIEIEVREQNGEALFSVKDNGIGIPKDKQEGLFKKFYQVDTGARRKPGGTGLGLAICKGIVEGQGGRIYVDSDTNKGATFYFTLPIG